VTRVFNAICFVLQGLRLLLCGCNTHREQGKTKTNSKIASVLFYIPHLPLNDDLHEVILFRSTECGALHFYIYFQAMKKIIRCMREFPQHPQWQLRPSGIIDASFTVHSQLINKTLKAFNRMAPLGHFPGQLFWPPCGLSCLKQITNGLEWDSLRLSDLGAGVELHAKYSEKHDLNVHKVTQIGIE
jgi:hypothetical protein